MMKNDPKPTCLLWDIYELLPVCVAGKKEDSTLPCVGCFFSFKMILICSMLFGHDHLAQKMFLLCPQSDRYHEVKYC